MEFVVVSAYRGIDMDIDLRRLRFKFERQAGCELSALIYYIEKNILYAELQFNNNFNKIVDTLLLIEIISLVEQKHNC